MENLKKARKAKGLTAEQLAKTLNFSKTTINKYEQGINEPDIETLMKISKLLDCSVDYLIGNEQGITISKKEYESLIQAKENLKKAQQAIEAIEERITESAISINGNNNSVEVNAPILMNTNKTK